LDLRDFEIKHGQLLHNGQPILIKGVKRHDHNPRTGHYLTEDDMRGDLLQMKRANINAVRTSHYPNDAAFLGLCDELGFCVISEANIESHGMGYDKECLAKDPPVRPRHVLVPDLTGPGFAASWVMRRSIAVVMAGLLAASCSSPQGVSVPSIANPLEPQRYTWYPQRATAGPVLVFVSIPRQEAVV
jgi:hypothetical protein